MVTIDKLWIEIKKTSLLVIDHFRFFISYKFLAGRLILKQKFWHSHSILL